MAARPTSDGSSPAQRTGADFHDEIQAHLALEQDRLMADGLTPDEARDAAHRAFGSVTAARERFHEASRWIWLEQIRQDVRYAWRGLWRSRAFVATTVATLAVALGLITVVFTIFNAYVLRPFAVHDPYSLHQVSWRVQDASGRRFAWPDYEELRGRRDLFEEAIAEATRPVSSDGRALDAAFVSGNYFQTLGVRMHLGRALADVDTRVPGGDPVAVLSHRAWTRLLDGDPAAVGRPFDLNGRRFVIIGVARPEFTGLDDSPRDLWLPMTMYPTLTGLDLFRTGTVSAGVARATVAGRDGTGPGDVAPGAARPGVVAAAAVREVRVTVRLRRDVTPARAQGALAPFMARILTQDAVRAEVTPQATPNPLSLELIVLLSPVFAAFLLVLVAACANVSNVMLARANARHREIALRLSLGASRGRVVRQLLTEGLLIALLAGLAGLALAQVALRTGLAAFFAVVPPTMGAMVRVMPLEFDRRVFLFSLGVATGATILFALLPALQATRLSLTDALRGEAGARMRSATLRQGLVVSQVAVSLLLLVPAITLVRNGTRLEATALGLDTRGVLSVNQRGDGAPMIDRAAAVLQADPRIAQVAVTTHNPLFERMRRIAIVPMDASDVAGAPAQGATSAPTGALTGPPTSPLASPTASLPARATTPRPTTTTTTTRYNFVSPEYFSLLRIPLVRGRGFLAEEGVAEARVAIVSAAAAKTFWPGADPIGRTLRIERSPAPGIDDLPAYSQVTVIGVVQDVVSGMVFDGRDASNLYLPTSATGTHATALLARARSLRDGWAEAIRPVLETAHPDPLAFEAIPLDELVSLQLFPIRASSWIGAVLGAIALVLSVSGLYGVLTYTLSQRTKEIGIRMALGATAAAVVRLVMRQCARLAGIGAAVGLVLAFAVMKTMSALVPLANVSLLDATAFAAGLLLAITAASLAAWYPARRATRISPSLALHTDA